MAVLNRVWQIIVAAGAIAGLIASALQIAQAVRDGDLSLVLSSVVVLSDAALLLALILIIRKRRAAKLTGGTPKKGFIAIWVIGATLLITTLALVISLVQGGKSHSEPPPHASSKVPSPAANTSSSSPPLTQRDCVDESGASASCDSPSSYFPVNFPTCAPDDVLRHFSIDPDEQQLDLEARPVQGECLLRPGAAARSAGATARDFARFQDGVVDTRFRLCLPTDQGPIVACSMLHHIELVSPTIDVGRGAAPVASACQQPARRYTLRSLNDPVGELQPVLLGSGSDNHRTYRCGVRSSLALKDTVWHLGTAPLPTG